MTRRIDFAALQLPVPPAFPSPELYGYARHLRQDLVAFLKDVSTARWIGSSANRNIRAVREYFTLSGLGDMFQHPLALPYENWALFHEPQITGGLAWFLGSGGSSASLARVQAFLRAASGKDTITLTEVQLISAEHPVKRLIERRRNAPQTEHGRLDLLIIGQEKEKRHAIIVEAKFGHVLSQKQIDIYNHAVQDNLNPSDPGSCPLVDNKFKPVQNTATCSFIILAPTLTTTSSTVLKRPSNRHWSFLSWDRLLVRIEMELARTPQYDDDAFRRFRRVLWTRAYFQ